MNLITTYCTTCNKRILIPDYFETCTCKTCGEEIDVIQGVEWINTLNKEFNNPSEETIARASETEAFKQMKEHNTGLSDRVIFNRLYKDFSDKTFKIRLSPLCECGNSIIISKGKFDLEEVFDGIKAIIPILAGAAFIETVLFMFGIMAALETVITLVILLIVLIVIYLVNYSMVKEDSNKLAFRCAKCNKLYSEIEFDYEGYRGDKSDESKGADN